jgi:transposase
MNTDQMEMVSLEQLVSVEHVYRKFMQLLDFTSIAERLQKLENNKHHRAKGYGIEVLFRCLLLQFIEDVSEREKMLQENNAAKYFCGFQLCEVTPDFSLFSKTRKKIGPEELGALFAKKRDQLRAHGYMNEVFNFVDASHLVSKAALWKERDEAIKQRYE